MKSRKLFRKCLLIRASRKRGVGGGGVSLDTINDVMARSSLLLNCTSARKSDGTSCVEESRVVLISMLR